MVADADAPDIDDVVAELSVVEPTAFTAARNARAKELRAAKERDRAALVAKLPKPSWTAWALNVLAREEPDAIASWLAAGEALEAALGGRDRDVLREAQRDERSALAATIERADAILVGAGRKADDQTAPKLTGTLRAAITDPPTRDLLTRGVLVDDVEASAVGFGFGFGFASSDDAVGADVVALDEVRARRAARSTGASAKTAKKAQRSDADTDAAADEERLAAEAAAEAKAAAAEAKRIEAERSRLARELRALERELAARSAAAEAADEAAVAAREVADAAADAVAEAQAAVDDARAVLDSLPSA